MIDDSELIIEDAYSVSISVDDMPEEGVYAATYGDSSRWLEGEGFTLWPDLVDED